MHIYISLKSVQKYRIGHLCRTPYCYTVCWTLYRRKRCWRFYKKKTQTFSNTPKIIIQQRLFVETNFLRIFGEKKVPPTVNFFQTFSKYYLKMSIYVFVGYRWKDFAIRWTVCVLKAKFKRMLRPFRQCLTNQRFTIRGVKIIGQNA